jgi:hypothetical protein
MIATLRAAAVAGSEKNGFLHFLCKILGSLLECVDPLFVLQHPQLVREEVSFTI